MDTFVEKIVQKNPKAKDYLAKTGIIIAAVLIAAAMFIGLSGTPLRDFRLVLFLPIVYGAYIVFGNTNVEYEYCITSAYIDVDKILSKRKRKKVLRMDLADIGIVAPLSYKEYQTIRKGDMDIVVKAVVDMTYDDIYYIVGKTDTGKTCLIYVHVDDRTLAAFQTYAGKKLVLGDE